MTVRESDVRELWDRRLELGVSREVVSRQLDPPVSSKTLERWEKSESRMPGFRAAQLRKLYVRYEKATAA